MPMIIREETRKLPCKLTEEEVGAKSQELAKSVQEIAAEEESQTNLKAQMKARLTEMQSRMTGLSLVVTRKEELRDVAVDIELSEDGKVIREIRQDTGEVCNVRPPRDFERQKKFPSDK